ncbi:MAG: hypothetical protein AB7P08_17250 [Burkholderiales bacterium]
MDLISFLLGLVAGAALAAAGFVVWNWESPESVDGAEGSIREFTDEYEDAKKKVKARLERD